MHASWLCWSLRWWAWHMEYDEWRSLKEWTRKGEKIKRSETAMWPPPRGLKYAGFMQTVPEAGKTSILGKKSAAGMMSTDNAVYIPHWTAYLLIYIDCSINLAEVQIMSMWRQLGLKVWADRSSYLATMAMTIRWDRWHLSSLKLPSEKDRLSLRSMVWLKSVTWIKIVHVVGEEAEKKKCVSGFYKAVDPKKGAP